MNSTISLRWTLDGVFWECGGRRRKITSDQAVRVLSLIWKGGWRTEAVTLMERIQ